jgi:hypothetical protein
MARSRTRWTWTLAMAVTVAAGVARADDGDLEVTMTLLPNGAELPGAVTSEIALPLTASTQATEHAASGLVQANEARQTGAAHRSSALASAAERRDGLETAVAEARERGAEASEVAEQAREEVVRGGLTQSGENAPEPPLPDFELPTAGGTPRPGA